MVLLKKSLKCHLSRVDEPLNKSILSLVGVLCPNFMESPSACGCMKKCQVQPSENSSEHLWLIGFELIHLNGYYWAYMLQFTKPY